MFDNQHFEILENIDKADRQKGCVQVRVSQSDLEFSAENIKLDLHHHHPTLLRILEQISASQYES